MTGLLIEESAEAFGELANPYRRLLLVHCYRMLGSIDDAEDAVQDTFLRAWNGRATFREAGSFQAWLYRIATNACLDAIERRRRSGARDQPFGVGPFPDDLFEEPSPSPEARYDAHESISLAFLAALQLLPPRQRSVLILRDVLAWRAAEVAMLLELSVPAVNSALHRARTTLSERYPPAGLPGRPGPSPAVGKLRTLLERYVRAWESADVAALVALLRDDAVVSMPPGLTFLGPAAIGAFISETVFSGDLRLRLAPIRANGGPGFVVYSGRVSDPVLRGYAVVLVEADGSGIARLDVFAQPGLLGWFGLPAEIAG